jgi:hypothetical protein
MRQSAAALKNEAILFKSSILITNFAPCYRFVSAKFHTLYEPNKRGTAPFQDLNASSVHPEAAAEAVAEAAVDLQKVSNGHYPHH